MDNTLKKTAIAALLLAAACSSSGDQPGDAATPQTAAPKAYVGLFGDNAVAVIDTRTNQVIKTIAVPAGPHGLVVTPDGAKVFVSSDGASTISVIDTGTDAVAATIDVGMTPHGLSISPDGKRVVCAGFGTDAAMIIDTATNQVVSHVGVPHPHNSAISLDGQRAYVGSQQKDTPSIAVVGMDTGAVVGSVPLPQAPRALDFAPGGKVYFTVAGVDGLEVLDPATNQLAPAPIATGGSPHHMLPTKDGRYELVVSQTAGDLEYVDVAAAKVVGAVPTGKAPHWIALGADGTRAYVTNESDNTVAVVDLVERRVLTTIPVGKGPRKIAVQPAGGAPTAARAGAIMQVQATTGFAFSPARLTIPVGTTVRWTNEGPVPHTVTSGQSSRPADHPGALFDHPLPAGGAVEVTFTTAGDFTYFCRYHEGMGMAGLVSVTSSSGTEARGARWQGEQRR